MFLFKYVEGLNLVRVMGFCLDVVCGCLVGIVRRFVFWSFK